MTFQKLITFSFIGLCLCFFDGCTRESNSKPPSLNKNPQVNAKYPQIIEFNSKLYATWLEENHIDYKKGIYQVRVAVYNAKDDTPQWKFVDGNGTNGLNKISSYDAITPLEIIVFDAKLYVLWYQEKSVYDRQVQLAVYNGNDDAPVWRFIDGAFLKGRKSDTKADIYVEYLTVHSSKLYASTRETKAQGSNKHTKQVHVTVYNGNDDAPAWKGVSGNKVQGIKKDSSRDASDLRLTTFESKLYGTWRETSDKGFDSVHVAVYNGKDRKPAWTFVDGGNNNGLNTHSKRSSRASKLVVSNKKLYVTWEEIGARTQFIRVAVYNGNDAAPAWMLVDGKNVKGINKGLYTYRSSPDLIPFNSKLYAKWNTLVIDESNRRATKRTMSLGMAVYNGNDDAPVWNHLQEGPSSLLKGASDRTVGTIPFYVYNSKLYGTSS